MSDFGFVGAAYEAPSIFQDTQELINWYPEVDAEKNPGTKAMGVPGDRGVVALYPTPGLATLLTLPAPGPVRALHPLNGDAALLTVCGNTLYSVNQSYVATSIGRLSTDTGPVWITDNAVSAYLIAGQTRYSYNLSSGALTALTDGPFPDGVVCDEVDNFIIYNRPNSNQWGCTDVGLATSGGLNLGQKLGASDNIVALIADHRQVLLLGEKTSEWWVNTGAFPFPFQIIPGTSMQHGCVAPGSVARLGESEAFLARDTRGQSVVVHMAGYAPKRISTHAVETDIAKGTVADAIAYTYQQTGHEFYVLTFPTQDKTWCYDLATQLWHKRAWRDSRNVLHRHRSNCCASFNGQIVVGDWENGKLYALSQSTYTDAGDAIPCIRRCPHVLADLKRVSHHDLQIQFEPGVGLQSGQGSDPQAMLRWSNDGGKTWPGQRWATIGTVGAYKNRAMWRRLGYARDRVYEVTVTDPVFRAVVSANLNASAGAS